MATDMGYDRAGVFGQVSPYEGHVLPANGVVEKLFGEATHGSFGLGQDHQAAGVLVDPVYEAEPRERIFAEGGVLLPEIPRDTIDQCARVVADRRMDDDARGLVDDHHLLIFIPDVEG